MMVSVDVEEAYRKHGGARVRFATLRVGPDDASHVVAEVVAASLTRNSTTSVVDLRSYWLRAVADTAASWHRSNRRRADREQQSPTGESLASQTWQRTLDGFLRT